MHAWDQSLAHVEPTRAGIRGVVYRRRKRRHVELGRLSYGNPVKTGGPSRVVPFKFAGFA